MENNRKPIEIKSGPSWFFGAIGLGSLIGAIFTSFGDVAFGEIWGLWLFAISGIGLFKVGEFWLTDEHYIVRDIFWRKKFSNLSDLKWIEFRYKDSIHIWIGDDKIEIKKQGPKFKKIKAAIEQIGQERLSYYGYEMAERSKLSRGQLSGCLDCHEIFPPTELKNWEKLPKSLLMGRKSDQYFSRCPSCRGGWIYTNYDLSRTVKKSALQKMDATFKLNKDTQIRAIISETLAYQTSFKYLK